MIQVLSLLLCIAVSLATSSACQLAGYDMTFLSSKDMQASTGSLSFAFRACEPAAACDDGASFCITEDRDHPEITSTTGLAYWSNIHATRLPISGRDENGTGPVMRFTSFSDCDIGGVARVSFEFVCNPTAKQPVIGVGSAQQCVYDASIASAELCQEPTGGS